MLRFFLLTILGLSAVCGLANTDSLKQVYLNLTDQDKKYEALEILASKLIFENADSGRKYATQYLTEASKRNDVRGQAYAYDMIGRSHAWQAKYDQAIINYNRSLEHYKRINHVDGIASCLINIGGVYYDKADYPKTIDFWQQALSIIEKTGDRSRLSSITTNLGVVYQAINEYSKAMQYFRQSLALGLEFNNKTSIGFSYANIGETYLKTNNLDSALWYSIKSLEIFSEVNHVRGIGLQYNTIGKIHLQKGQLDIAHEAFLKTLELLKEFKALLGLAEAHIGIGSIMLSNKKWREAAVHCAEGRFLAIDGEARELQIAACACLVDAFEQQGDYLKAYSYFKEKTQLQDSIFNQANATEIARLEIGYQIDKEKEIAMLHLAQQEELAKTEIQNQKKLTIGVLAGLSVVIVLLILIWLNYNRKNRLAIALSEQKKQLEERSKDITDSIQYAKRIQKAILPSTAKMNESLPDSFVLYLPKDIVAGDFYWMETAACVSESIPAKKDNIILLAAADCTGHGVPGAMVSVICNNGLNRAVREHGLTKPGEILDKAREIVIQEFAKSEEDVNDGMDISLAAIHNDQLTWAGANNPMWLVRRKTGNISETPDNEYELIELKPDKQPIGKFASAKPFVTQKIELKKGDTIYLLTDGFQDQFGGYKTQHQKPAGKKLKAARLQRLLLNIQHQTLKQQRESLYQFFEDWRGELEQVDDVCVIGVRV